MGAYSDSLMMKNTEAEGKRMKKYRILAFVIALTWVFTVSALGENNAWDCPECGKKGNTGNFCGNCGYPHSSMANSEKQEALSGGENDFAMNAPMLIKNEYGSYRFTLEGAHILSGEWEQIAQMYHTDDCMIISVQGVCDNIDCKWLNNRDYIPNVQIQKDIKVTDQEDFSLESFGLTMEDFGMPREAFSLMGGFRDGRYEVFAETAPGQKKRVSLIYFAFKENTSVIVSVPGYDGSVEIELK